MLRLDRLEISGFKSFSDRTEVRLPAGITAVVGPNGCGKSNIGDAINWVLGEQSPKMLRGKQMADVIFAGTRDRKPLGMAEVSLHFAGAEGLPRQDQGQVSITRRLFRSGESEYLINGKRCRLKDIQDLLHEARVGARTYATIEQGRIDQILNAKPKERRLIIEDAAGVASYKNKRRLTEMKLEATQANLLRVNDIVIEVERQIRSLKRQASKARRYRTLRDELRSKERVRFALRASELDEDLARVRGEESKARDAEAEASATLSRLEVELIEQRSALERSNTAFRETSERLHQLEIEIDREEGRIGSCRERIEEAERTAERQSAEGDELDARRAETQGRCDEQQIRVEGEREELERVRLACVERQNAAEGADQANRELRDGIEGLRRRQFETMNRAADLRNRLRSIDEALERNQAQLSRSEAEKAGASADWSRLRGEASDLTETLERQRRQEDELRRACDECDQALRATREQLTGERERLAESREAEQSAATRLGTLEDLANRFAGVSDGVRSLLADAESTGLRAVGVVADFIEARTDVESVAEGYLQSFLPTVILQDDADVRRAAEMLHTTGAGRTNLLSRSHPAGRPAVGVSPNGKGEVPLELFDDPRVRGRLSDGLSLRSSTNGVVQDRLGEAILVDDLEAGLALHRAFPSVDYLTPDGDVVYASGVVSVGSPARTDHGLLAHNRRVDEARAQMAEAAERTGVLQERVQVRAAEVERLEAELAERRPALDDISRKRVEFEMQLRRSSEETERTGRQAEVLEQEIAALEEELKRLLGERAAVVAEADEAESLNGGVEAALVEKVESAALRETELKRLSAEAADLRAELAAKRQRQESSDQELQRLNETAAELQERVDNARSAVDDARRRAVESAELQSVTEREMLQNLEESKQLGVQAAEMEREIAERQKLLGERENGLRGLREGLDACREATRQHELKLARSEEARKHLDDLCLQELGVSASEAGASLEELPVDVDLDALEEEIGQVKGKIERLGGVNLESIEEFSELEERHTFLTTQRQDLDQSMESLRESIRRINRTSRERFNRAFESIRGSYQEIFKVLFNGGRADLKLEEEEDVLEAGIEILAQPPGKRLGSVQLLSGGEKALSAIALLFAVFRYQPSPFCLLDEVDAALDEANVGRFSRMVREYAKQTQFIIVTHNKLSMERADLLYGVTMEEPGVSRLVSMEMH